MDFPHAQVELRCSGGDERASQLAEYRWPLTDTALVNRHFAYIEELEEAQLARCAALQHHPGQVRSTTSLHWWS